MMFYNTSGYPADTRMSFGFTANNLSGHHRQMNSQKFLSWSLEDFRNSS